MAERPTDSVVPDLAEMDTSTDDEFLDALDREVQQLEQEGHEPERRPNMSLEEVRREVEAAAEGYERSREKEGTEPEKEESEEPVTREGDVEEEEEEDEEREGRGHREDPETEARRRREEAMSQEEVEVSLVPHSCLENAFFTLTFCAPCST